MKHRLRPLALALLVPLALGLQACGGGSESDVKDLLDSAFKNSIKSANVNLDVTLKLDGIQQLKDPVKLSLEGPYEAGPEGKLPKVDWDIAVNAAGQSFTAGLVSTSDNAFVKFQGTAYEAGTAVVAQINQQIKAAAAQQGNKKKGLSQFGVQARNWIKDAKEEGDEKVAGVETTHVSASLDVARFLEDVNKIVGQAGGSLPGGQKAPQLSEQDKKQIQDVVKNPRFDVYVGKDDKIIRRLSADISFDIPKNRQAQLNNLKSGRISFSIEFSEVGKPQKITTPTNARPLSELTSQLGVLGGGGASSGSSGSGSSGSGSGSGTGTGSVQSQQLEAYSKCLQKADPSKPDELQKCADLLK
jgi:hypothetical protein